MDAAQLESVERQRQELEANIAQLRKTLRYWQTLEIDYEGLIEEFRGLPAGTSSEEGLQVARDFGPEKLSDDELKSLLQKADHGPRSPTQVVEVLAKRVEYVSRNIDTIRKQLSIAERRRNALLLAATPEHQDEAKLPLQDISEELDEDGNVLSSRVEAPAQNAPDLLQTLEKAGIASLAEHDVEFHVAAVADVPERALQPSTPLAEEIPDSDRLEQPSAVSTGSDLPDLSPTNPDDNEADAFLRQEMLRYGMDEVNAVVAELDLNDDLSDDSDDQEADDWSEDDEDLYSDQSEDERGATKNPIISTQYKRKMEALQKRHGIDDLQNLGPSPDLPEAVRDQLDKPPAAEAAGKAAIARNGEVKSALKQVRDVKSGPSKSSKKVVFASDLDVADESSPSGMKVAGAPALVESVIERNPVSSEPERISTATSSTTPEPQTKKMSRFRAARSSDSSGSTSISETAARQSLVSARSAQLLSSTIVERPSSTKRTPVDPADFDEALHARQVAAEYQRMRNRKIHEQGGYVRGGESENWGDELAAQTVIDEDTGKARKVSRFKAARMNP